MNQSKILVNGKFSPDDLVVSVSESNRKIDPKIEGQLDALWEAKVKRAKENGITNCYNGISYRINTIEEKGGKLVIDFGTFEYKVRDGLIEIPEYFNLPEEYYRKGCFNRATIKTRDDKYLMVELSGKSFNSYKIDFVGGIMEVNVPIMSGKDVFESMYVELEEEAGIEKDDIAEIYLRAVYLRPNTNVCFLFGVDLRVSSFELLARFSNNKDADIRSLKTYSEKEYWDYLKNCGEESKQSLCEILQSTSCQ